MRIFGYAVLLFVALLVGSVLLRGCWWIGRAADVAQQQFDPKEMLRRYEWFKDAAAALDKKAADMQVYDARLASLSESYGGNPRSAWAREDREQANIWSTEAAGIRASYNGLAAEYNAQMAKFNWRFTNAGDLPNGATQVLPREYRTYNVGGE